MRALVCVCMEPIKPDAVAPGRADRVNTAARPAEATRATGLGHAGRLLSHAESLTPAGWRDVVQRVRALDVTAHRRALQRLSHALDGVAQRHLLDALNHGACAAAHGAVSAGPLADDRAAQTCTYAGRVAAHAVLALALAAELPAEDVDLLTSPFHDAPNATGSRRVVARAD